MVTQDFLTDYRCIILKNVKIFQFPRSTCCIIGQHALRRKENLTVLEYSKKKGEGKMLYRTYRMYDDRMEIMVPSTLIAGSASPVAQYHWQSEDRKVVVDVARGGVDLNEEGLYERLNEYYKGFCKDITNFQCLHIEKRNVNGHSYGELRYTSDMMGYRFYNIFMLGSLEGRELVLTLQCMDKDAKSHLHIFEIISDSLRILRKNNSQAGGGRYDSEG